MLDEKSNSSDFLQIRYYAFENDNGVEDFAEIDSFKKSINENYENFVRVKPIGRGGGAYEFAIHCITSIANHPWQDHLVGFKVVGQQIGLEPTYTYQQLKDLGQRMLALIDSYKKLKDINPILDCCSFHLEFKDFDIYIYKTSKDSLISNFYKIMSEIYIHRDKIEKIGDSRVTEIHIPVVKDISKGQDLYRTPIGEAENLEMNEKDLFGLWGIKYQSSQLSKIYDLNSKDFINSCFYTDEEFYKEFF